MLPARRPAAGDGPTGNRDRNRRRGAAAARRRDDPQRQNRRHDDGRARRIRTAGREPEAGYARIHLRRHENARDPHRGPHARRRPARSAPHGDQRSGRDRLRHRAARRPHGSRRVGLGRRDRPHAREQHRRGDLGQAGRRAGAHRRRRSRRRGVDVRARTQLHHAEQLAALHRGRVPRLVDRRHLALGHPVDRRAERRLLDGDLRLAGRQRRHHDYDQERQPERRQGVVQRLRRREIRHPDARDARLLRVRPLAVRTIRLPGCDGRDVRTLLRRLRRHAPL